MNKFGCLRFFIRDHRVVALMGLTTRKVCYKHIIEKLKNHFGG